MVAVRQHRTLIVTAAAVTTVLAALLLLTAARLPGTCPDLDRCANEHSRMLAVGDALLRALVAVPLLVAAFWGAPLLPREYEQGTHLLAWSQDVSPARWVRVKVTVLSGVAALAGLVLWLAARPLVHDMLALAPSPAYRSAFANVPFATGAPMGAAYALFALAAGVLVGAAVRRTVAAIALSVLVAGAAYGVLALVARPHYATPRRALAPADVPAPDVPANALVLRENVWADSRGDVRDFPPPCESSNDYVSCVRAHGVTQRVTIYQPASRLATFRVEEAALTITGALASGGLTTFMVRRR